MKLHLIIEYVVLCLGTGISGPFEQAFEESLGHSKININTCAKFELYLNLKVRSCENDLALLIVHTSKIQALLLSSTR